MEKRFKTLEIVCHLREEDLMLSQGVSSAEVNRKLGLKKLEVGKQVQLVAKLSEVNVCVAMAAKYPAQQLIEGMPSSRLVVLLLWNSTTRRILSATRANSLLT